VQRRALIVDRRCALAFLLSKLGRSRPAFSEQVAIEDDVHECGEAGTEARSAGGSDHLTAKGWLRTPRRRCARAPRGMPHEGGLSTVDRACGRTYAGAGAHEDEQSESGE
jgi:hypothetical protein